MPARRSLLLAGLAAPALIHRAAAQPAPAAAPAMPGFYRFRLGSFTVTTVHDGGRLMPVQGFVLNAPLQDVQATLAESFMPGDSYRNIYTATLVDTGRHLVLFDTGTGPVPGGTSGMLQQNLRAAGIDPARITHVVLSHFHGDHIGGLITAEGSAAFPNAELVVPEAEWRFWTEASNETRSPERQRANFANTARRFAPYQGKVRQIAAGAEAVPGIRSQAAYGHTPGHTIFHIGDGSAQMMFLADTTHRPELIARRPGYHTIFDFDPVAAEASRRRVLDQVATDRIRVTGFHFPFPASGWMAKLADGYRFVPAEWSAAL